MQDDLNPIESPEPEPESPERPSRKAIWLAMGSVALALTLLWLAPGLGEPPFDEAATTVSEYAGDPADGDQVGTQARLDFTIKDMNGVDVSLDAFKGKVVLLNFWATWCGPCRVEIPFLIELQNEYSGDLVVLGLSVDDPPEKLVPYAAEFKMNYPVLVGNGREDVQEAFGPLYGIPVSVFIGRDGVIAHKHSGIATKEQFDREIKALL